MPTQGFIFDSNNVGTNRAPIVQKLPVLGTTAIMPGDLLVVDPTTGYLKPCAAPVSEVTAYALAPRPTANATSGDLVEVGIIRKEHIFRVSSDSPTTTAIANGATKTIELVSQKQVKLSALPGTGSIILWTISALDDVGNILAFVSFSNTTAG